MVDAGSEGRPEAAGGAIVLDDEAPTAAAGGDKGGLCEPDEFERRGRIADQLWPNRRVAFCFPTGAARPGRVRAAGPHDGGRGLHYQRLREHLAYLGMTSAAEHLSGELDRALKEKLSATSEKSGHSQHSRYPRVVAITFARTNGEWTATVTPPDGPELEAGPGPLVDVVRALVNGGCHQTDVSDAVFTAAPYAWQELFDPERKYEKYYKDRM